MIKTSQFEPGNIVPTFVSTEAWAVARAMYEEVEALLAAHGVVRLVDQAHSELPGIMARMVQLAINRAMEKVDA